MKKFSSIHSVLMIAILAQTAGVLAQEKPRLVTRVKETAEKAWDWTKEKADEVRDFIQRGIADPKGLSQEQLDKLSKDLKQFTNKLDRVKTCLANKTCTKEDITQFRNEAIVLATIGIPTLIVGLGALAVGGAVLYKRYSAQEVQRWVDEKMKQFQNDGYSDVVKNAIRNTLTSIKRGYITNYDKLDDHVMNLRLHRNGLDKDAEVKLLKKIYEVSGLKR